MVKPSIHHFSNAILSVITYHLSVQISVKRYRVAILIQYQSFYNRCKQHLNTLLNIQSS